MFEVEAEAGHGGFPGKADLSEQPGEGIERVGVEADLVEGLSGQARGFAEAASFDVQVSADAFDVRRQPRAALEDEAEAGGPQPAEDAGGPAGDLAGRGVHEFGQFAEGSAVAVACFQKQPFAPGQMLGQRQQAVHLGPPTEHRAAGSRQFQYRIASHGIAPRAGVR